jgi:hypothetical protein
MMEFKETKAGQSKAMPSRIVIYGVPKVGKTAFAAQADDVFFINVEGGLDYLEKEVRTTPKLESYDEIIGWLGHIYKTDDFTCGTIAIDSLDWCENLAQAKLIKQENATSIIDPRIPAFAYHKGVAEAASMTIHVLNYLDAIYKKKGIPSIVISHSQVKTLDLPNQDAYSRHELKLSKGLAAKVNEWADLILFAGYSFHVTKDGKTTEPRRVLYGGGSMAYVGGGRMTLKKELPLNYNELKKEITQ